MALNGIDISSWQSGLNLNNISLDFAIIKATQGGDYVNPVCDVHYQQAKAKGIKRGVYHFADHGDVVTEANYFVDNILGYVGDAILVLDWEGIFVGDVAWAKEWLDIVHARTGVKPIIYMSESVVKAHDWSSVIAGDYGLWVAKYRDYDVDYNYDKSGIGNDPAVSWGDAGYVLWQWTSSGRLNGYGGNLDLNEFYGDGGTWDAYARVNKPAETPAPEPTPAPTPEPTPAPAPTPTPVPVETKPNDNDGDVPVKTPDPVVLPPIEEPNIPEVEPVELNIPPLARIIIYVVTAIGTPIVAYLLIKGYIGPNEVALWSGEVTVVSAMAALKVKE